MEVPLFMVQPKRREPCSSMCWFNSAKLAKEDGQEVMLSFGFLYSCIDLKIVGYSTNLAHLLSPH